MIPKQTTRSLQSESKTPGLKRFLLLQAIAAFLALLSGCGLKGDLYIPAEESAEGAEVEIETEIKTGSGTGTQTTIELESVETEPVELESVEKTAPESN